MHDDSHRSVPICGHVYLKPGKRGASWYYRARLPREVRKRLGPAWTGKGRPPTGYFTRKTAEAKLQEILADARRGTLAGAVESGATFADAAAEWLRYVEHDRKRKPSTIADYQGVSSTRSTRSSGRCRSKRSRPSGSTRTARGSSRKAACRRGRSTSTWSILHGILRRAMRVYGLRSNPAALVDRQPLRRSGDFAGALPRRGRGARPRRRERPGRRALPGRRVHRPAARRAARAALAGRRLREAARPRPPQLHPRRRGRPEVRAGAVACR